MPRRSPGCFKCRKRKVRCDETKPSCTRCADYGVACPGYRPEAGKDIRFVDQTSHIARKSGSIIQPENHSAHDKNQRPANGKGRFRFRNQFATDVVCISGGTGQISHRHLHRIQLLSTFLELYLPQKRDDRILSHFAYISALPSVDLSTPLLQLSIDTLCLAELGSLYNDQHCLNESKNRYVRALPMLVRELNKPKLQQMQRGHILASIAVLALCELFDVIGKETGPDGGHGWISHVQGAQQYLRAIGPEAICTPLDWLLLHNVRHASLCMGLVRRRKVFFTEEKWTRLTRSLATQDAYVALYDLALQIPGLLELSDELSTSADCRTDAWDLLQQTCYLRDRLEGWRAHFQSTIEHQCHNVVNVDSMETFFRLCHDQTFKTVFTFPSVQQCSQLQLFWICCLLLDFTVANTYRMYGKRQNLPPLDVFTSRSKPDIWREMYVNATNYCRTVPFCCEPDTGSIGRIGTFLLRISQSFFEICDYANEARWCRNVRHMLEAQAEQLRSGDQDQTGAEQTRYSQSMLVSGEYPNWTYTPRLGEQIADQDRYFDPSTPSFLRKEKAREKACPTFASVPELELRDLDPLAGRASAVMVDDPVTSSRPRVLYSIADETQRFVVSSQRDAGESLPRAPLDAPDLTTLPKINGATALADERVLMSGMSPGVLGSDNVALWNGSPSQINEQKQGDAGRLPLTFAECEQLSTMWDDARLVPEGMSRKGPVGGMCW